MVCLVEPAYAVARGVDELSRRLGIGAFEVGDNWKCPSCFENDSPNFPLCTECKSSYVYEVTILKRSDAFNHRRDVRIATPGLGTGLSAGLLNARRKSGEGILQLHTHGVISVFRRNAERDSDRFSFPGGYLPVSSDEFEVCPQTNDSHRMGPVRGHQYSLLLGNLSWRTNRRVHPGVLAYVFGLHNT
ncbi:uncharacterized protein PAC_02227 [Phialocephala subalpina]|uniref:RanBP2-type domain-containing protein n=1 Tax=Phialocephala subalpina TaxID=576137 RepID=A0A1L7WHU9_9HELO|nr:uncharacterized protein PAC_02227 [Phialocephala subalpina]